MHSTCSRVVQHRALIHGHCPTDVIPWLAPAPKLHRARLCPVWATAEGVAREELRGTLSHPSEFWVTSPPEDYGQGGVLFRGNMRAQNTRAAWQSTSQRLGTQWRLFFSVDEKERPVAVVLPAASAEQQQQASLPLAVALAAATFGVALWSSAQQQGGYLEALPGTAAFALLLGTHELSHVAVARQLGVTLSPPYFLPAALGLVGSFGAITPVRSTLPDRGVLLRIAAAGPAAGAAASLTCLLIGLVLTAAGQGQVQLDAKAFEDSLLVGALGQAVLGSKLTATTVATHPLALAGWAGLIVNAINCIPLGELDGGRMACALWGRRAAGRIGAVTTLLLAIGGALDELALYWLLLALFLQRGPVAPQEEELSVPEQRLLPALLLALPLLVLLPFPYSFGPPGADF